MHAAAGDAAPARIDAASVRSWAVDANDGVIATAGILEGFAGAGASDHLLLVVALVATIAGALAVGGAKWAEESAERESQLATIAQEAGELAADPQREIDELVEHYRGKGLDAQLARQVAEQLTAHDALAAQLETEHGIAEVTTVGQTFRTGLAASVAFLLGAMIPLLVTVLVPVQAEPWVILVAVIVSLTVTSFLTARGGHLSVLRTLGRTLTVGVGTLAVSYVVGLLLF